MEHVSLGKQISEARKENGLTQEELAFKCHLHIRTIQRIESGEVTPRSYTLRLINDVLGTDFYIKEGGITEEDERLYRIRFMRRKRFRIISFISVMVLMVAVFLLAFPSWRLFGMPKLVWAPYFYLIMFVHIAGIAISWRCPFCNALLGDVFSTRFCSKCGFVFKGKY